MTEHVGQIAPRDRIAILLILLMNIPDMGNLGIVRVDVTGWTVADQVATWIQRVVFAGTQRGMLELLFGAGMLIMAARAMKPDGPVAVADAYYRRNLWLVLFGLAHALLFMWWGEILLPYGLAALLIFQFRTLAPRTLLVMGLTVLLASGGWQGKQQYDSRVALLHDAPAALALKAEGKPLSDEQQATIKRWDGLQGFAHGTGEDVEAERTGRTTGFVAFFNWNLAEWIHFSQSWLIIVILEAASTMLIGAALFKWGVIQGKRTASFYLWMMLGCYAIALPLRIHDTNQVMSLTFEPRAGWIYYQFARLAMTLGHLALINLAVTTHVGRALFKPFEAAGRIPLSVYFGQSIICLWILFSSFGLGLWGQFGMAGLMAIARAVVAAQVVIANLWLRWFDNGPFEWLWKSLAYAHFQPFRKTSR
jgi:uncharacterized protein